MQARTNRGGGVGPTGDETKGGRGGRVPRCSQELIGWDKSRDRSRGMGQVEGCPCKKVWTKLWIGDRKLWIKWAQDCESAPKHDRKLWIAVNTGQVIWHCLPNWAVNVASWFALVGLRPVGCIRGPSATTRSHTSYWTYVIALIDGYSSPDALCATFMHCSAHLWACDQHHWCPLHRARERHCPLHCPTPHMWHQVNLGWQKKKRQQRWHAGRRSTSRCISVSFIVLCLWTSLVPQRIAQLKEQKKNIAGAKA